MDMEVCRRRINLLMQKRRLIEREIHQTRMQKRPGDFPCSSFFPFSPINYLDPGRSRSSKIKRLKAELERLEEELKYHLTKLNK